MLLALTLALAAAAPPRPVCILPDGSVIRLELAVTDQERETGLMFRDWLPDDAGMLFIFDSEARWPFWMKNTFIPLDMVWLDGAGVITDLRTHVQPCRRDPCPSYAPRAPARAVLELKAGVAAAHSLAVGQKLRFDNVSGYPIPERAKP
jgi:hypothetical protein